MSLKNARLLATLTIPEPIRAGREYFLIWNTVRVKCPGPTVNPEDPIHRAAVRRFIVQVFRATLNICQGEGCMGAIADMAPALYSTWWGVRR